MFKTKGRPRLFANWTGWYIGSLLPSPASCDTPAYTHISAYTYISVSIQENGKSAKINIKTNCEKRERRESIWPGNDFPLNLRLDTHKGFETINDTIQWACRNGHWCCLYCVCGMDCVSVHIYTHTDTKQAEWQISIHTLLRPSILAVFVCLWLSVCIYLLLCMYVCTRVYLEHTVPLFMYERTNAIKACLEGLFSHIDWYLLTPGVYLEHTALLLCN